MKTTNVSYTDSVAVEKLTHQLHSKNPLRLAFLDIDSTMTAGDKTAATNHARQLLEHNGYVVVFVTSKTEEILVSQAQREQSSLNRPVPKLAKSRHGTYSYTDPVNTEAPGILDPDIIIGSTGTNIFVKQAKGGYRVDEAYRSTFPPLSTTWRKEILAIIAKLNDSYHLCHVNEIEHYDSYTKGKTNVYPPDYRIEVKFKTLKFKRQFVELMKQFIQPADPYLNFQIADDSNPAAQKYALYITPKYADKVHAVEYVLDNIVNILPIDRHDLEVLFAGDSYPDLAMGLRGGVDTNATFLLVGNSRLTKYLLEKDTEYFADESLKDIKPLLVAHESTKNGVYNFIVRGSGKRRVIIGDEAYPGTIGPETIVAYLL